MRRAMAVFLIFRRSIRDALLIVGFAMTALVAVYAIADRQAISILLSSMPAEQLAQMISLLFDALLTLALAVAILSLLYRSFYRWVAADDRQPAATETL